MDAFSLILPLVAAGSLTVALFVPLRDGRRGERATLRKGAPLRASLLVNARSEAGGDTVSSRTFRFIDIVNALTEACTSALRLLPVTVPANHMPVTMERSDDDVDTEGTSFADRVKNVDRAVGPILPANPNFEGDLLSQPRERPESDPPAPAEAAIDPESTHIAASRPSPATLEESTTILSRAIAHDVPPPLTRLRLRPDRGTPTWPRELPLPHVGLTDFERRNILRELARHADLSHERALATAYREEDDAGRAIALRAVARLASHTSNEILVEALQRGSDEERALAVDLLAARGDFDSLVHALEDRVEAIAARAALAFVRSNRRSDYEHALSHRVEPQRLEAIIALLAGTLE